MNAPLRLILPVEIQSRELDAKLLLACVLAERGGEAIVGCHQAIKRNLHLMPRSIYVSKGVTQHSLELYSRRAERSGHTIVAWDEEGLVYMTRETYLRRKVWPEALASTQALFAWGEDNAEIWRSAPGYVGQPLFASGNPRADLLRPDLRAYFARAAEELRGRYGRFVLISSNFGHLHHYLKSENKPLSGYRKPVPPEKIGTLDDPAMAAHRFEMLQAFKRMLPELARRLPDRRFVVRPHPSEDPGHWREAAQDCQNVEIVGGGPIVPWLLAAESILHNGCTTAVEGFLLGRPTIAYEPIHHPIYDIRLPNALSHAAPDLDTLADRVVRAGDAGFEPTAEQVALARHHVAAQDGPLASERIADALEGAAPSWGPGLTGAPLLIGRAWGHWRAIRRLPRIKLGREPRARYIRHRFPDLSMEDVEARIQRLRKVTKRFADVRASKQGRNIFEIRAS